MARLRIRAMLALSFVALVVLAACSGGAAAPAGPGGGDGSTTDTTNDGGGPKPGGDPYASQPPQTTGDQQLIVYTGSLDVEVADLRPAMDQAEQLVVAQGGHVAASRMQNSTTAQSATVTYRIPAEHWADALAGLRTIGTRLLSETTGSENVTMQVVDMDARLANLRATETALQSIMDRATTIDDVLSVQSELTSVRGDIESLTAQRDLLANQAALGTLDVTFEVPVAATSRASQDWDLGQQVDDALAALVRLGQLVVSLLIWLLLVGLPILVPVVVIAYIALRLRRRWVANHPRTEPATALVPPSIPPPGPWSDDVQP